MNEGLQTQEITLADVCLNADYIRRYVYLGPLFDVLRDCAEIVISRVDPTGTTFSAAVAVLRPDTYARLLAAEQELMELRRAGGNYAGGNREST